MIEIELNSAGIKELLKSAEITGECQRQAENIAAAAAGNFETRTLNLGTRNTVLVETTDKETFFKQRKSGQILNVIGGMMK